MASDGSGPQPISGALNLRSLITVGPIAEGGMGRVVLAARVDGSFRRLYAVKRLHSHCLSDANLRAMFIDEARIAGLMHHPNVVAAIDVGEDADGPYLVMDYVNGLAVSELLRSLSKQRILMPLQVGLRIALDAAQGLHAVHELRDHDGTPLDVVHRDMTPHNILLGYDGTVRITDFGVAKADGRAVRTSTGVLKGKIAYMSPEQLRFEEIDRLSDLFSLGVVLFEMLSGRRLYKMSESRASIRRILDEPPPDLAEFRPEAPPELVSLLFDLLHKDPTMRPVTAEVLAEEIQSILSELVSEEGTVPVRPFIQSVTADHRREQQKKLARAVDTQPPSENAPRSGVKTATRLPFSGKRWLQRGIGMTMMLGAGVWIGGFTRDLEEESSMPFSSPAPERQEAPIQPALEASLPVGSDDTEVEVEVETDPIAESEPGEEPPVVPALPESRRPTRRTMSGDRHDRHDRNRRPHLSEDDEATEPEALTPQQWEAW